MIILRETGGYFSGGAEEFARRANDEDVMLSRRCVAVRAVPAFKVGRGSQSAAGKSCKHLVGYGSGDGQLMAQEESAREIQERLAKELYEVVVPWTNRGMPGN